MFTIFFPPLSFLSSPPSVSSLWRRGKRRGGEEESIDVDVVDVDVDVEDVDVEDDGSGEESES